MVVAHPIETSNHSAAGVQDDELLGVLLDAHRQSAFNLAYRLVRRPEDAADAVQDAFVLAVRATRSDTAAPRDGDRFRPWLLKIVANVALGQLRRKRSDTATSLDELTLEPADPRGEQPLTALMRRERRGDVLNALLILPDDQRAALTLREYQELSYDEIGALLGLDRAATTALIYKARCTFRRTYQGLQAWAAPIGCPDLAPLLSAMLDEELGLETWRDVDQHVAGCRRCWFELRRLRGARRLHATIPLLAPPTGWSWAATLEGARTAGGVGTAGLAASLAHLGPAAGGGASALPGAALAGLMSAFGGLVSGRMTGLALVVGLNVGIMVGAPTHQSTSPHVAQAAAAPATVAGAREPEQPVPAAMASAGPPDIPSTDAPVSDPAARTAMVSAAARAGTVGDSAPEAAGHEAAGQSAPAGLAQDGLRATEAQISAPTDDATAMQAASPDATVAGPDSAPRDASEAASAPGAAGAGSGPAPAPIGQVASTAGAVVDVVSGVPEGELPTLALPALDPPSLGVPPIDPASIDPPAIDLPPVDLPAIQAPPIDVPPIDVPPVTVPGAVQAPPVDLPPVDLPAVQAPAVNPPPVDPAPAHAPGVALPALETPGDQAKGDTGATRRAAEVVEQTLTDAASHGPRAQPDRAGAGTDPTHGTDEQAPGAGLLVDASGDATTVTATEGGARVEIDAAVGTDSATRDGGGTMLTVDAATDASGNATSVSASIDTGGPGVGILQSEEAGSQGANASAGVGVDSGGGSVTLESNGTSASFSVDSGSGGGSGDSGGGISLSVDAGSSSDSSGGSSGGGDNGGSDNGGGISVSAGGISVSVP